MSITRYLIVSSILFPLPLLAEVLIFKNGDRLTGKVISESDDKVVFESPHLGKIEFLKSALEISDEANAKPEEKTAPIAAQEKSQIIQATETLEKRFKAFIPQGWHGSFTFGFNFRDTNTKRSSWNLGLRAKKSSEKNHYNLSTFYNYSEQTNQNGRTFKSTDKYGGSFDYKHDVSEQWFIQAKSNYRRDLIKDINHQVTESLGIGYRVLNKKKVKLNLTPALSLEYNDIDGVDEASWTQLATFINTFEYKFNDYISLEQHSMFSINPKDSHDYKTRFDATMTGKMSKWAQAKIHFEHNFDNLVSDNVPSTDQRLLFSLGLPF